MPKLKWTGEEAIGVPGLVFEPGEAVDYAALPFPEEEAETLIREQPGFEKIDGEGPVEELPEDEEPEVEIELEANLPKRGRPRK